MARTLAEAADMIAATTPTAVLLDLTLPDSCAKETLAKIRDMKKAAHGAPVVVVTGNPSITEKEAREAGADSFFSKTQNDASFFAKLRGISFPAPSEPKSVVDQVESQVRDLVK